MSSLLVVERDEHLTAVQPGIGRVPSSACRPSPSGAAPAGAPMARHRILAGTDLLTFFVEPHCAFAERLRERCGDGVTAAAELRGLTEAERCPGGGPSRVLDLRLVAAMDAVTALGTSMPDVTAEVGMPLLRWRAWVRLRVAAEALRDGRSILDAAITGGLRRPGPPDALDARDDGLDVDGRAGGAAWLDGRVRRRWNRFGRRTPGLHPATAPLAATTGAERDHAPPAPPSG